MPVVVFFVVVLPYVPAAEYEAVRRFFVAVREALNPAVVLKR